MDGTRFDHLIKRLAATPVTRATALRGLAASAAALAGVTLLAEPDSAAAAGKRRRRRRVCDCASADPNTCTNRRLKRRAARRLLRSNACAYKGRCQTGVSGCAAVGCDPRNPTGSCPEGQICDSRAICVAGCIGQNGTRGSCPAEQVCVNGQCQTGPVCTPACNRNQVCCPSNTAKAGQCHGTLQAC